MPGDNASDSLIINKDIKEYYAVIYHISVHFSPHLKVIFPGTSMSKR